MDQRGPVYPNGVPSPPPSKQASMQSRSSNGNVVYGFSPAPVNGVMSPSQAQMALFYDGHQVASPQPMPQSPYPVPTPRNTLIEDPEYQEFLEQKRRRQMAEAEQQQRQQQQVFQQQQQEPPWAQQQNWQQLQQQRFSPSPYPLPPHFQRGSQSSYASMDDVDQQYQQFAPPQPYVHAIRPGHTYGKITARGKAKIMMGNGVSGKSSGFERQHNYGEVDIQDDVQIKAGDFGAAEITTFFHRPS